MQESQAIKNQHIVIMASLRKRGWSAHFDDFVDVVIYGHKTAVKIRVPIILVALQDS